MSQLLQNSRYRKAYLAHMRTVVEENITNNWYFNRGHDIQQSISGYVADDPNKFYTFAEFRSNISSTVIGNNSSIVGITELMDGRIQFLQSHPDIVAEPPVITDITTYPGYTPVTVTATVTNAETILFKYRYHPLEPYKTISMADDGMHHDGISGDNVYGASIPAGALHLQYYIYAENGEAAAFDPPRAEYACHTLSVSGDVVTNEFMASNDAAVADQDGEFDDWIELYNNTGQEVTLTGWTLSDDLTDSTRWTFPDTAIQAFGYLIIWADRDEEQAGLHAGFRISADGEVLLLMNSNREIMDEIAFGPQETDLTYGRYPNGTGAFAVMNPTFGSENSGPTAVIPEDGINVPDNFVLEQNYPNPFNAETRIRYGVHETCHLTLSIYNVHGQEVEKLIDNKQHETGYFEVDWNSADHMSGVYIYRLYGQPLTGLSRFDLTNKMVIIK